MNDHYCVLVTHMDGRREIGICNVSKMMAKGYACITAKSVEILPIRQEYQRVHLSPEELETIDNHMKSVEQAWQRESPFPKQIVRLADWPNVHQMLLNKHEPGSEDSLGHLWRVVMYYPLNNVEVGEFAIELDDRQGPIEDQAVEKIRRVCALGLQTADRLEE